MPTSSDHSFFFKLKFSLEDLKTSGTTRTQWLNTCRKPDQGGVRVLTVVPHHPNCQAPQTTHPPSQAPLQLGVYPKFPDPKGPPTPFLLLQLGVIANFRGPKWPPHRQCRGRKSWKKFRNTRIEWVSETLWVCAGVCVYINLTSHCRKFKQYNSMRE